MTYVELDYPDQEAARAASTLLDEMEITGEWYLRQVPGDQWRLSIAAEGDLSDAAVVQLGGKTVDESADDATDGTRSASTAGRE